MHFSTEAAMINIREIDHVVLRAAGHAFQRETDWHRRTPAG
jgi:hypothetical protein